MEHQQIVISGDEGVSLAFHRFAAQQDEIEDRLGISVLLGEAFEHGQGLKSKKRRPAAQVGSEQGSAPSEEIPGTEL